MWEGCGKGVSTVPPIPPPVTPCGVVPLSASSERDFCTSTLPASFRDVGTKPLSKSVGMYGIEEGGGDLRRDLNEDSECAAHLKALAFTHHSSK